MKLEIVIPTYNHPTYIDFILKCYQDKYAQYDFVISIHDSSTNEEVKNIVLSSPYLNERVFYYAYPSEMDVDEKTVLALKKGQAEYVMLCGDGFVVNLDNLFSKDYINKDYNVVHIYDIKRELYRNYFNKNIKQSTVYQDRSKYLCDNYWHLILYGSSLVKKSVYDKVDENYIIKKYNKTGFIYPSMIAEYVEDGYFVTSDDFLLPNVMKKDSIWVSQGSALRIWSKQFSITLDLLSDVVEKETTEFIIKTTGKRTEFLTFKGLLKFKSNGNFNYKIYKEYKNYFKRTKACSNFGVFIVLLTPKFVAKLIVSFKHIINKLLGK